MEHEGDGDTSCDWYTWNDTQKLIKAGGGFRNQTTSRNPPDNSIVGIVQNTEKSPGDLRRLTIIQTPAEDHPFTLV